MDPRRYNLHPHEQQRVANYFEPGMSVELLEDRDGFGSWKILERGARWLMQHDNGAFMWVTVDGERAMAFELVMGPDAMALERR